MSKTNLYMIALMPPADLSNEIDSIRKEFGKKYNCKKALANPVHITLQAPFSMDEELELAAIETLAPIAYYQQPFQVALENFGSFPDNGVIFIELIKNPVLRTFQRNLISRLKKVEAPAIPYSLMFHPHITIGYRDIPPEVYETARAEYGERHFRGKFTAESFYLWKRVGNKWTVLHEFEFRGEQKPDNFTDFMETPLGIIEIAATDRALLSLSFREPGHAGVKKENRITKITMRQLREYFDGTLRAFTVPLDAEGSDFQVKVWTLLQNIPFGERITYQALSKRYGDERAIRAVGLANGKNPIPIIIPCHRVVGINGKLTGYSGGLWRKQWLLEHELKQCGLGQQMLF